MTNLQKSQIILLRSEGKSYIKIAEVLGISENTVKSFCKRNNIKKEEQTEDEKVQSENRCLSCKRKIKQKEHRKEKKFCCDKCRMDWWNSHREKINHKIVSEIKCRNCGMTFSVYGRTERKYCSHECYIFHRFGGQAYE